MMRISHLRTTTALVAALLVAPMSGAALADQHDAPSFILEQPSETWLSSSLIGETVYASIGDDGEALGSVTDLVVSPAGQIEAVVIGVGGFAGVGDKPVAVPFDAIRPYRMTEGGMRLVLPTTKESLKAAPRFTPSETGGVDLAKALGLDPETREELARSAQERLASAQASAAETYASAKEAAAAGYAGAKQTVSETYQEAKKAAAATAEKVEKAASEGSDFDQLESLDLSEISIDALDGKRVYLTDDSDIGEISDVLTTSSGALQSVIVDFGGFLGIGEKPIAMTPEQLVFKSSKDGDAFYVYTTASREELKAAPKYEAAAAEN